MRVATMVSPLGMRTRLSPWNNATLLLNGQISGRKWLVQPESETIKYTGGVNIV